MQLLSTWLRTCWNLYTHRVKLLELVKWLRGEISRFTACCITSVQQQTGWLLCENVFPEQHQASQPLTSCYFHSARPLIHLPLWQTAGVFLLFSLKLCLKPALLPAQMCCQAACQRPLGLTCCRPDTPAPCPAPEGAANQPRYCCSPSLCSV